MSRSKDYIFERQGNKIKLVENFEEFHLDLKLFIENLI